MTAFVTGPLGAPLEEIARAMGAFLRAPIVDATTVAVGREHGRTTIGAALREFLLDLGGTETAPPDRIALDTAAPALHRLRASLQPLQDRPPWVWPDWLLSLTLPLVLEAVDTKATTILVCPPPGAYGRTTDLPEAYGFVLWEHYVRRALEALAGRPTVLLAGQAIDATAVEALVSRTLAARDELGTLDPRPFGELNETRPADGATREQQALWQLIEQAAGVHDRFPELDLGPESPWLRTLIEVRRPVELAQRRTHDAFLQATVALAVHTSPASKRTTMMSHYTPQLDAAADVDVYRRWLEQRASLLDAEERAALAVLAAHSAPPRFTVVVPVHRADPVRLQQALASVRNQSLPAEVVLAPQDEESLAVCRASTDGTAAPSVVVLPPAFDRASALNAAIDAVTTGFVAFLGQDDLLADGALAVVGRFLVEHPDHTVLYTDEDGIDDGGRFAPYFKPEWSPDLLQSSPYTGRLLVAEAAKLRDLGGFRSGRAGAEEYDLVLRVGRAGLDVGHVPRVAYHRRASVGALPPPITTAELVAVGDDVSQEEFDAVVERGLHPSTIRVRRTIAGNPKVSIIVPFRDQADLLRRCIDSVHRTAGYDNWELVLVDNQSWEPETTALLRRVADDPRCRVIDHPHPFNWSTINNVAARSTDADVFLFMNSDIEATADGWLRALLEHAQRPEVGVVGARLLYPDGRVQHAGAVFGLGCWVAWHAFVFLHGDDPGYFAHAKQVKNYSAVTGACMAVRRDVFERLGGFDERLGVAFNDMDFCLRARREGYRVVYTPFAELVHYEGASRGRAALELEETRFMLENWAAVIRDDPYFNRNLDPARSEFALAMGIGEVDPWDRLFSTLEN